MEVQACRLARRRCRPVAFLAGWVARRSDAARRRASPCLPSALIISGRGGRALPGEQVTAVSRRRRGVAQRIWTPLRATGGHGPPGAGPPWDGDLDGALCRSSWDGSCPAPVARTRRPGAARAKPEPPLSPTELGLSAPPDRHAINSRHPARHFGPCLFGADSGTWDK